MKRYIKTAIILDKVQRGDELFVTWTWPEGAKYNTQTGYALCEYLGKTRDGKHRFESCTYGDIYLVDLKSDEVITPRGHHYAIDNSSGWANGLV